jgi:RND superfamily putative drug exporter
MKLLGDWNWYLPNWLNWLPRLEHGSTVQLPAPPAPLALPQPVDA